MRLVPLAAVEGKSDQEAVAYYQIEKRNNLDARNNLGVMYFQGRGVEKCEKKALKHYQKAAQKGHAIARFNLGFMICLQ